MRLVFMGTPDFAVAALQALLQSNHQVAAVITAPDKPAGRGLVIQESPVKRLALDHGIKVLQPTNLKNPEFLAELKSIQAELFIVVAFRMLPEVIIQMPPKGCINLHASLLPDYRGAAPINWAIIKGEKITGITTFFIRREIDTGDIILSEKVEIPEEINAGTLHDILMQRGARLIISSLEQIEQPDFQPKPQTTALIEKKAPKLTRDNTRISWNDSSGNIHNLIRGLSPYPAAWTMHNGKIFKILEGRVSHSKEQQQPGLGKVIEDKLIVGTGDGNYEILMLQTEGKKKMDIKSFLSGFRKKEIELI